MVVVVQPVFSVIRDVQIFPPIIVVISRANALAPSRGGKPGLGGNVRESPIMIVVIKVIGRSVLRRKSLQRRSVHNKNIGPPIVVVIKNRHSRSSRLDNVFFGVHSPEHIYRREPCFFRDIAEICEPWTKGALFPPPPPRPW